MPAAIPNSFDVALDRDEFVRVTALESSRPVTFIVGVPTFFVMLFALIPLEEQVEHLGLPWLPPLVLLLLAAVSLALGATVARLYRATLARRQAGRRFEGYLARVEGAFLHVVDGRSDRKTHFRDIVDYQLEFPETGSRETAELRLSIRGCGRLSIPAVADPLATRDLLAEIDAIRERDDWQPPAPGNEKAPG